MIIDSLFPNFIFTTILDVDFDSHNKYYKHRRKRHEQKNNLILQRPTKPPFLDHHHSSTSSSATKSSLSTSKSLSSSSSIEAAREESIEEDTKGNKQIAIRRHKNLPKSSRYDRESGDQRAVATRFSELFVEPTKKQPPASSEKMSPSKQPASDSEMIQPLEAQRRLQGDSSVPIEIADGANRFAGQHQSAVTSGQTSTVNSKRQNQRQHHYEDKHPATGKNGHNLKSTDHLTQTATTTTRLAGDDFHQVRL